MYIKRECIYTEFNRGSEAETRGQRERERARNTESERGRERAKERERKRERQRETERDRGRQRQRERQRERERVVFYQPLSISGTTYSIQNKNTKRKYPLCGCRCKFLVVVLSLLDNCLMWIQSIQGMKWTLALL